MPEHEDLSEMPSLRKPRRRAGDELSEAPSLDKRAKGGRVGGLPEALPLESASPAGPEEDLSQAPSLVRDRARDRGEELSEAPSLERAAGPAVSEGEHLGPYRVIRLLGRGGMGIVYEVEHEALEKRFALKLIPDELAREKGFVSRFQREARVTARLEHPNIVRVDDFGEQQGQFWLRMELMQGLDAGAHVEGALGQAVSLFDLMQAAGGRLPEKLAARVLEEALAGLAHAHASEVVHRDVKPGNILLCEGAEGLVAKVADFGLVKVVGEERLRSMADASFERSLSMEGTAAGDAATSTRALVGTYEYMAPEQRRGAEVDARADVYAMGLVAYRMLTGQREIGFELPSRMVPGIHPAWDGFIRRALEADKAERFEDAGEMQKAVEEFSRELGRAAVVAAPTPKARKGESAGRAAALGRALRKVKKSGLPEELASRLREAEEALSRARDFMESTPAAAETLLESARGIIEPLEERGNAVADVDWEALKRFHRDAHDRMLSAITEADGKLLSGRGDEALADYRALPEAFKGLLRLARERQDDFEHLNEMVVKLTKRRRSKEKMLMEFNPKGNAEARGLLERLAELVESGDHAAVADTFPHVSAKVEKAIKSAEARAEKLKRRGESLKAAREWLIEGATILLVKLIGLAVGCGGVALAVYGVLLESVVVIVIGVILLIAGFVVLRGG